MAAFKSYLALCRVGNLPTIWTNVLAASLLTGNLDPAGYLLLGLAISAFYLAGMSLNDVCDADIDRIQRPERPIPSGRISLSAARNLTFVLFAAGLGLLALMPHWQGLAAGGVLIAAIVVYDLRHKNNPASVLIMAACRFLVFAVASLSLTGAFAPLALAAGSVQFIYIVALSLVARYDNAHPFPFPIIPWLLAGIALVDGLILAVLHHPAWFLAGLAGAGLTRWAQKRFRGD